MDIPRVNGPPAADERTGVAYREFRTPPLPSCPEVPCPQHQMPLPVPTAQTVCPCGSMKTEAMPDSGLSGAVRTRLGVVLGFVFPLPSWPLPFDPEMRSQQYTLPLCTAHARYELALAKAKAEG